jgi:serine/threonine protein phosphatase 1
MKFVIGDIHGEITKLRCLVENILKLNQNPEFIFIGDYIDKGESAKKTIDFLIELKNKYKCIFLEGNHEYQWLNLTPDNNIEEYLLKYGGNLTIDSFPGIESVFQMKNLLLNKYKDFFNEMVSYWENEKFVITHSGIPPNLHSKKIADIEKKLLLFNRYDFIKMDRKFNGKIIIFGHTGFYTPYYDGVKIGLDTSACYLENQPITAFCLDEEFFVNSDNIKLSLKDIDLTFCPNIVRTKPWRNYD